MLSFLREREPEDLSLESESAGGRVYSGGQCGQTQETRDKTQETRHKSGERKGYGGGEEYLAVAAQNKNARRSTMVLAVLFGMGLLCLWFMIKKRTLPTAPGAVVSTEEAQIEQAIARLTGVRSEMFNRMDEIVKKFYEFSDVQQVKVDELVKNPFEQEIFLVNVQEISDNKEGNFDADAGMMKRQQMREQTESMQLMSLMKSDVGNCCMIDDKILYEGDTIKGFKVSQISDSFVKLEWDPELDEGSLGTESEGVEIILKLLK